MPVSTSVESLVDQSLVRVGDRAGSRPRFGMLETIREFGLERLAEHDETEPSSEAHADYFLALAERAEPELTGPAQAVWLDRLEAEHANVRAALRWALGDGDPVVALRLVGALWHFWQVRGHVGEGRAWAEEAWRPGDRRPTVARGRALRAAGLLAEYHGDYDRAVVWHEEAAAVWRELGDERNLARTLDHLGNCAHDRGDLTTAASCMSRRWNLHAASGTPAGSPAPSATSASWPSTPAIWKRHASGSRRR